MGAAREVGHQPLEETFTDNNILDLRLRHPDEIRCHTFTKRKEGVNGADWEWWLTNRSKSQWLGLRVQAKILELRSDRFAHLHYRKSGSIQATKLDRECKKEGLIPLYCFYSHSKHISASSVGHCHSFSYSPESYGCAIAPVSHVHRLRNAKERCGLDDVLSGALPWHCLVCCEGYGGEDLPARARSFLARAFTPEETVVSQKAPSESVGFPELRSRPPGYVASILEGQAPEAPSENVRGVVIVREADG
ncbi:DUF6615 family protein [Methyloversatilis sp.]|uniref:DUF6615 family protein n=1 Tax=Methyloversatilis sp. TaxID=2569862 RepID=UPI003524E9B7